MAMMSAMLTRIWPMARSGFTSPGPPALGRRMLSQDPRRAGHPFPAREPGEVEERGCHIGQHAVGELLPMRSSADQDERYRVERMCGHRLALRVAGFVGVAVIGGDRQPRAGGPRDPRCDRFDCSDDLAKAPIRSAARCTPTAPTAGL